MLARMWSAVRIWGSVLSFLVLAACGGPKEPEPATGPTCEKALGRTMELIAKDPAMSQQLAAMSEEERATRAADSIKQCESEQWSLELRACFANAKSNGDLGKCAELRARPK